MTCSGTSQFTNKRAYKYKLSQIEKTYNYEFIINVLLHFRCIKKYIYIRIVNNLTLA